MAKAPARADQAKQVRNVYIEWCVKAAEIILDARLDPQDALEPQVKPHSSESFNLKVPELWNVRGEAIAKPEFFQVKTQRSFQIEIFLDPAEHSLAQPLVAADMAEEDGLLLERWTFLFVPAPDASASDRVNQTLVQKLKVTLRSLLCFTRVLPAYAICRGPCPLPGMRRHRFRVAAAPTSRPAQDMLTQDFASLQSSVGSLRLSVSHWKDIGTLQRRPEVSPFGSQIGEIEVEEGYVASSEPALATPPAAKTGGRLGKIAEHPQASTAASSAYSEGPSLLFRQLPHSGSIASETSSNISRTSSMADHTVVLGSTPPLAFVSQGLAPPPGLLTSACSSRSATPHSTPKLVAQPSPRMVPGSSPSATPTLGPHVPPHMPGGNSSAASPASSQHAGCAGQASRPGEFEDLSDLWANFPAEFVGRRRTMSSGGHSRCSIGSASGAGSGPASRDSSPAPSRRGSKTLPEPTGEIFLLGMSDDEEDAQSDSLSEDSPQHDDMEHNVVASTLLERGDGAFVFSSECPLTPEQLGLDSVLALEVAASRASGISSSSRASPRQGPSSPRTCSPLIAMLNPFVVPSLLELPAAEMDGSGNSRLIETEALGCRNADDGAEAATGSLAASATAQDLGGGVAEADTEANPDAQHLLVEMGDLVCKLQQRRELNLTLLEVPTDDLFAQLAHFRELAESVELQPHLNSTY